MIRRKRGGDRRTVFDRQRLAPTQLRTVADRRFADARALLDLEQNERLNAAMYLAGFVVECLLKAELLDAHGWLRSAATPAERTDEERELWDLCYHSHDLTAILERLPEDVHERLARFDQRGAPNAAVLLRQLCGRWTIFARYSPAMASRDEARRFVNNVDKVKRCLA